MFTQAVIETLLLKNTKLLSPNRTLKNREKSLKIIEIYMFIVIMLQKGSIMYSFTYPPERESEREGGGERENRHPLCMFKGKSRWISPGGAGHDCLNLNFRQNFPLGLYVILQIQIKKIENDCYIMWKIILIENPSRFNVEPLLK